MWEVKCLAISSSKRARSVSPLRNGRGIDWIGYHKDRRGFWNPEGLARKVQDSSHRTQNLHGGQGTCTRHIAGWFHGVFG